MGARARLSRYPGNMPVVLYATTPRSQGLSERATARERGDDWYRVVGVEYLCCKETMVQWECEVRDGNSRGVFFSAAHATITRLLCLFWRPSKGFGLRKLYIVW